MSVFRFDKEHKKRLGDELKSKKQELSRAREEIHAATEPIKRREHRQRRKRVKHEIFELKRKRRTAKEGVAVEPETGTLPDFIVIGAQKGGTTYLYNLLTRHPLVDPAASKEVHFFDNLFDLGVEWYRRCFPAPRWEHGRRSITGESTPYYLFHPDVPRRMAELVPQVRLIALLRNPVDRAYSHYHKIVREGLESLSFEEAIETEAVRLRSDADRTLQNEHYPSLDHRYFSYLSRGVYVDQLLRWVTFFSKEQLLVLKSEDFFERPPETLKRVLNFLDLPEWEPGFSELGDKRNEGKYAQSMDRATRRRLEEYFEPHNQRLYDFLGRDLGW